MKLQRYVLSVPLAGGTYFKGKIEKSTGSTVRCPIYATHYDTLEEAADVIVLYDYFNENRRRLGQKEDVFSNMEIETLFIDYFTI